MFNLTTDEKQFEFDFEMALLDIKAERYGDAEQKLSTVARNIKSGNAYLGIGVSKLGKYVNGEANVAEVFFCFEKAMALSNSKDKIAAIMSEFILNVANEMVELIIRKAYELKQAEGKELLSQLALAGSIIVNPLIKGKKDLETLNIGAGIFSILNMSAEKKNKMLAGMEGRVMTVKIEELKISSLEFFSSFPELSEHLSQSFEKLEDYAFNAIASSEQKQVDRKEKQINSLEPSDPYFSFRSRAIDSFENKQYLTALENIKEALLKVPDDSELLKFQKESISELATKATMPLLYIAYVFMGLAVLEFIDSESGNIIIDGARSSVVMLSLFVITGVIFILAILKMRNEKIRLKAVYL